METSKIDVSVIIVNYNGELFIENCLKSFLAQNYSASEIIVVDNSSTDKSLELIKSFDSIKLFALDKNLGYGYALNYGIKKSKGSVVVLANNDITLKSNWINEIIKSIKSNDKCGLVASKVMYMDEPNKINSTGMLFYKDLSAVNRGLDEIDNGQYDKTEEVFGAYGVLMAFKKEVFDKIGFFDEDYFLFREEDEFMWRMRKHGWITLYNPFAVVYHKRSANTKLFSPFKLFYSERNRFWNVLKYMPLTCTITTLPFVINRYVQNLLLILNKGQSKKKSSLKSESKLIIIKTILRAWILAIAGFYKMYKKRIEFNKNAVLNFNDCYKLSKKYSATIKDMIK